MKQVVQNYKSGELSVSDVPPPVVEPGWVLVENHCSLISAGTERNSVEMAKKNLVGKARARPDLVKKVVDQVQKEGLVDTVKMVMGRLDTRAALGYSCAGIVIDVGDSNSGFAIGDRVACTGQNYASHAELVCVPKNLCVKVPSAVDLEDASYVAMGAIALQGVRQAEPRLGETVAVIGLGLLGQLVAQILRANGCRVIATDLDPTKLELAQSLGTEFAVPGEDFTRTCEAITQGHGVDSVILTASTKHSGPVTTAGQICRRKGRVVVVGATGMDIPRDDYYAKELELRLSTSYGPGRYDSSYEEAGHDYPYGYVRWSEKRNMAAFLALIAQQSIALKPLTTHRFALEQAESAYTMITEASEPYLGICLQYRQDDTEQKRQNRQPLIGLAASTPPAAIVLGIIGAGNHIKDMLLPHFSNQATVNIRAVCTQTGINARSVAESLGAEDCYTDYREILADDNITAVLVGTRHDSHGEIVNGALVAGKHVFVEKPLCLTLDELETIDKTYRQATATKPLILQVGFNRRHSPHAAHIRALFAGRVNPLMMLYRVNAGAIPADHWVQSPQIGGGRLVGEICHFIDFMQAISGATPCRVTSHPIDQHASGITADKVVITVNFSDGSIGTVFYAADGDKTLAKERFEAFADGKSVVMDDFLATETFAGGKKRKFTTRHRQKGFAEEVQLFIDSITGSTTDHELFNQAYQTTLTTLQAVESLKDSAPRTL